MQSIETSAPGPVAQRDAQGRWVAGQSGNPAGKQPGTRNRATLLREFLRDGEEGAAVRTIIEKATAGHWAAARFVVDGIAPKPRGRLIELDLPDDVGTIEAVDHVVWLMARGEITIEEAQSLIRLLRERSGERAATAAAPRRAAPPPPVEPASDLHLQVAAPAARAEIGPGRRAPPPLAATLRGSTSLTPAGAPLARTG
jgi:hypothetical protein